MKGTLVIVPCGQRKIWDEKPNLGPTPAQHAYIGAPFKVNKQYAERFARRWVILSAKYGFIAPDFIISGNYNVTFKNRSTNPVSVATLRDQVQQQGLNHLEIVIGLGGREYRDIVKEVFALLPAKLHFPFAGRPIGKAMREIKQAIDSGKLHPELSDAK